AQHDAHPGAAADAHARQLLRPPIHPVGQPAPREVSVPVNDRGVAGATPVEGLLQPIVEQGHSGGDRVRRAKKSTDAPATSQAKRPATCAQRAATARDGRTAALPARCSVSKRLARNGALMCQSARLAIKTANAT